MTELLTFTIPCPDSADDSADEKIDDVFFQGLFFSEKRLSHFMQIVSPGDNFYEMSRSDFLEE